MRKLFTFLGTQSYSECSYILPGNLGVSSPTRYAQLAIMEMLERTEKPLEEFVIFLTPEARESNWINGSDSEGRTIRGLRDALKARFGESSVRIKEVDITSSESEESLWQLFELMAEEAEENDEIYLDITYSFRSTPALLLIISNYVSVLRNVKLQGLYYGKVDAKLQSEYSKAVIFEMTEMLNLYKWSQAIDAYLRTGNAQLLVNTVNEIAPVHEVDRQFLELAERLNRVSMAIETCRGRMVEEAIREALEQLDYMKDDPSGRLKPFQKLLDRISEKLKGYKPGSYEESLLFIVDWCIKHHLYQQGYTFLNDGILTLMTRLAGLDPHDYKKRQKVKEVINEILGRNNKRLGPNMKKLAGKWAIFKPELEFIAMLSDCRNSLDHAQATGPNFTYHELVDWLPEFRDKAARLFARLHEFPGADNWKEQDT